eukprot:6316194-Amphidinium_carterae.1
MSRTVALVRALCCVAAMSGCRCSAACREVLADCSLDQTLLLLGPLPPQQGGIGFQIVFDVSLEA